MTLLIDELEADRMSNIKCGNPLIARAIIERISNRHALHVDLALYKVKSFLIATKRDKNHTNSRTRDLFRVLMHLKLN